MLVFEENLFGIPECELDLAKLFPDKKERLRFDGKLQSFLEVWPKSSRNLRSSDKLLETTTGE